MRRTCRSSRGRSQTTHSSSAPNRSGWSVSGFTRNSPRRPWGRAISPITTSRGAPPFVDSLTADLLGSFHELCRGAPSPGFVGPGARRRVAALLDDLEDGALAELRGVRVQDRANRARGPALLADHLAEIRLRDPKLDHRHRVAFDLRHVHVL